MSKDVPQAPDYTAAATAQGTASRENNEQQTWANRPNINTPFGQQSWDVTPTWDPTTNQYLNSWTQNTNLTPDSQAALDSQMRILRGRSGSAEQLLDNSKETLGSPMDWDHFQPMANGPQGGGYSAQPLQHSLDTSGLQSVDSSQKYNQQAGDAIYGQWNARMQPQMDQQKNQLRTQLYNSGLKEGDEAYDHAMNNLDQNQGQQRNDAQFQATIGSGAEAQRMQGMDLSNRQEQFGEVGAKGAFANTAADQALQQQLGAGGANFGEGMASANYNNQQRQQQIAEALQKRGMSINEINAMLNGQQVGLPATPSFTSAQGAASPNYLGAAGLSGQSMLDQFNAMNASRQGTYEGLSKIAGFGF